MSPAVPRSARIPLSFRAVDPLMAQAAREHGAAFVREVLTQTRRDIAALIGRSFYQGLPPRDAARLIRPMIGLTARQQAAVTRLEQRLIASGAGQVVAVKRATDYSKRLLRRRALTIARTETIRAEAAGAVSGWRSLQDTGQLSRAARKVWVTTPDDRLCPYCAPMDGAEATLDGEFSSPLGLGKVSAPPLHPNCRCAVGLTPGAVMVPAAAPKPTPTPRRPAARVFRREVSADHAFSARGLEISDYNRSSATPRSRRVQQIIENAARDVGRKMKHRGIVRINHGEGRTFVVNGRRMTEGGHFAPQTGEIVMQTSISPDPLDTKGMLAHEMHHARWEGMKRLQKREHQILGRMHYQQRTHRRGRRLFDASGQVLSGREEEFAARFPVSWRLRTVVPDAYTNLGKLPLDVQRALAEADGVSDYSTAYWKQWQQASPIDRKFAYDRAVDETLAEVSRIKTGAERWGDNLNQVRHKPWLDLYDDIEKLLELK